MLPPAGHHGKMQPRVSPKVMVFRPHRACGWAGDCKAPVDCVAPALKDSQILEKTRVEVPGTQLCLLNELINECMHLEHLGDKKPLVSDQKQTVYQPRHMSGRNGDSSWVDKM